MQIQYRWYNIYSKWLHLITHYTKYIIYSASIYAFNYSHRLYGQNVTGLLPAKSNHSTRIFDIDGDSEKPKTISAGAMKLDTVLSTVKHRSQQLQYRNLLCYIRLFSRWGIEKEATLWEVFLRIDLYIYVSKNRRSITPTRVTDRYRRGLGTGRRLNQSPGVLSPGDTNNQEKRKEKNGEKGEELGDSSWCSQHPIQAGPVPITAAVRSDSRVKAALPANIYFPLLFL